MAAKIVCFGIDDQEKIQALVSSGYSVASYSKLSDFRSALTSDSRVDAVIVEGDDWLLIDSFISMVRSLSSAPLILFWDNEAPADQPGFDLVVSQLTSPSEWLRLVTTLIRSERSDVTQIGKRRRRRRKSDFSRNAGDGHAERAEARRKGLSGSYCVRPQVPEPFISGNCQERPQDFAIEPFIESMAKDTLREFQAIASFSHCAKGTTLFVEEQMPQEVFVIEEGIVKLYISAENSRDLVVHYAGPGEILGLVAATTGEPHRTNAEALCPCRVAAVRCATFLEFLFLHPRVAESASRELARSCEQSLTCLRTFAKNTLIES